MTIYLSTARPSDGNSVSMFRYLVNKVELTMLF